MKIITSKFWLKTVNSCRISTHEQQILEALTFWLIFTKGRCPRIKWFGRDIPFIVLRIRSATLDVKIFCSAMCNTLNVKCFFSLGVLRWTERTCQVRSWGEFYQIMIKRSHCCCLAQTQLTKPNPSLECWPVLSCWVLIKPGTLTCFGKN